MTEDKKFRLPIFVAMSVTASVFVLLLTQSSENYSPLSFSAPNSTGVTPPQGSDASASVPLDWKDYSVPTLGISLKYPPNMTYVDWKPTSDILHSVSFYLTNDVHYPLYQVPEITLSVFANPNKQAVRDWMKARSDRTTSVPRKDSAAFFQGHSEPVGLIVSGEDGISFSESFRQVKAERALVAKGNLMISLAYTDFGDAKLKSVHKDILTSLRWSEPRGEIQISTSSAGSRNSDSLPNELAPVLLDIPVTTGYRLPWTAGTSLRLIQGWGGTSSHICPGQMCYAYDFDNGSNSFEGIPVRSAAEGRIVYVKSDSTPDTCGGYDYRNLANYVTINHSDGTATLYLHLKSASVVPGTATIGQGTIVGIGGKTGWTGCYAHLHFQRQAQGIWITNSTPVYFDEYPNTQLKELSQYTSQNGVSGTTCNNPSPQNDQVALYSNTNFCGTYKILGTGDYANPAAIGFPNDSAASVRVGGSVNASLCRDDNFSGGCTLLTSSDPDLSDTPLGSRQLSSLRVTMVTPVTDWRGDYFANPTLSGNPTFTRNDTNINFDWAQGAPDPRLPVDRFSVRWTRTLTLNAGTYRFTTTTDDGVRLWVDNALVIDKWIDQSSTSYSANVTLTAGAHTVKMEYYDNTWSAVAKLTYGNAPVAQSCAPISGESYGSLAINGLPTSIPAQSHPDLNLNIRGYQLVAETKALVDYAGSHDPSAPQLAGLFSDFRLPGFRNTYQVNGWDWSTNTRSGPVTDWPVTVLGMAVAPSEIMRVPTSGYAVGIPLQPAGYSALVLYASSQRITLKYTLDDNVVSGYTIHVENVCVEPRLQALYDQLNAGGRRQLPALFAGQGFGRAIDQEVRVAIRDDGSFLDPRSRADWWVGK